MQFEIDIARLALAAIREHHFVNFKSSDERRVQHAFPNMSGDCNVTFVL